ncbi:hypothetical protein NEOLEDRAFT_1063601 [Neolentinus lepideus HHB14362 ss-1]|uniref:ATP-dependent DNA helicase n=1 Tax=Neolentinus lepideus HHB14362 ss-1 TaxID=1314782 RepID=A0A165T985_9AGAM|nr:hypothetical protein NEOLEDRAFT_1063601 [Neolentinus lepideus HHB14362 ss-1]
MLRLRCGFSRFSQVPVNENSEFLQSPIQYNSSRADLLHNAHAIIWDEGPMANRAVGSSVDETCRISTNSSLPFSGKTIIMLGDFRQTCPVIRRGTR